MFNIFKKTRDSLERTREAWTGKITGVFDRTEFDDSLWDELEEVLIAADVGVGASLKLVERTRDRVKRKRSGRRSKPRGFWERKWKLFLDRLWRGILLSGRGNRRFC